MKNLVAAFLRMKKLNDYFFNILLLKLIDLWYDCFNQSTICSARVN